MVPATVMVKGRAFRVEVDRGFDGWFGLVFPEASGCVAMGPTLEATLRYAKANLADWLEDAETRRGHIYPLPLITAPARRRRTKAG